MFRLLIRLLDWFTRTTYTGRATGQKLIHERCIRCGREYSYLMRRTGTHSLQGPLNPTPEQQRDADLRAAEKLTAKLEGDCDPVPCPRCGDCQPAMVEQVKDGSVGWIKNWRTGLIVVGGMLFLFAGPMALGSISSDSIPAERLNGMRVAAVCLAMPGMLCFAAAIALTLFRSRLRDRHDPNAEAGAFERMKVGEARERVHRGAT